MKIPNANATMTLRPITDRIVHLYFLFPFVCPLWKIEPFLLPVRSYS